jgi:hypothetical protein
MTEVELALNALRRWMPLIVSVAALVLLPLLRERLRATFVTTETLDGFGQRLDMDMGGVCKRVDVLEVSISDIDTRVDNHVERLIRMEESDRHITESMSRLVVEPLERVVDRMEELVKIQSRQGETLAATVASVRAITTAVAALERRVDNADSRRN